MFTKVDARMDGLDGHYAVKQLLTAAVLKSFRQRFQHEGLKELYLTALALLHILQSCLDTEDRQLQLPQKTRHPRSCVCELRQSRKTRCTRFRPTELGRRKRYLILAALPLGHPASRSALLSPETVRQQRKRKSVTQDEK